MKNPIDETHDYVNELEEERRKLMEILGRVYFLLEYAVDDRLEFQTTSKNIKAEIKVITKKYWGSF